MGYFCTNNAKTDYNFPPPLTAWDELGRDAHWRHRGKDQPFLSVFNFEVTHESRAINKNGQFDGATRSLSDSERHDPNKARLPAYYPDTPVVRANRCASRQSNASRRVRRRADKPRVRR